MRHPASGAIPASQVQTATDQAAMTLAGYIAIAQAGTYNFNLAAHDGAQLTIGNQIIIAGGAMHSFEIDSGTAVFAAAGLYAINIQYFENSGYTCLEFWGSDGSGSGSGTCIVGRAANCNGTAAPRDLTHPAIFEGRELEAPFTSHVG